MLTMKADKWILLFALWLISVSSNGVEGCETRVTVTAPLGSSVLLPCSFLSNGPNWVKWTHWGEEDQRDRELVHLSSEGRVEFLEPRSGRVKTYPNQASETNFSITIDGVQNSDMGSYYCNRSDECFEVKLSEDEGEQFSEESCGKDFCKTSEVPAMLGSSVLLPCSLNGTAFKWVTWAHINKGNVVRLSSHGRVHFPDPRSGRVKAFPNQVLKMDYSIVIDKLENIDLGSYCCKQRNNCFRVELLEVRRKWSQSMQLLIYILACFAAFIVLSLFGYICWLKCMCLANKSRPDVIVTVSETTEGPSAPPQEVVRVNQIAGADNSLVYENDGPSRNPSGQPVVLQLQDGNRPRPSEIGIYPNLDEFKFERVESQRTRQRFHIDLISRLRQASFNRHFYVNQGEIHKQQAMAAQTENKKAGMGRRKAKDSCEYKNPIYNRSTDHLNRL
ncbi:hypothetical protein AMECASPLE_021211 [Ameca splendens]|uniref:Ig-like domain-containing protein n=1 Tax=Ameca splendens TaxID=208324 RepID=A0ABV0XSS0_9TELE